MKLTKLTYFLALAGLTVLLGCSQSDQTGSDKQSDTASTNSAPATAPPPSTAPASTNPAGK